MPVRSGRISVQPDAHRKDCSAAERGISECSPSGFVQVYPILDNAFFGNELYHRSSFHNSLQLPFPHWRS